MRLHIPKRLLRVVTHGRGMWERKLDVASMPDKNIFVRDHLMDTGRFTPSPSNIPAAFEDPTQFVSLGSLLNRWMCADIKIDALEGSTLSYQIPNVADVDYMIFESKLQHHNPQRGRINRVYVQIHNRGIQAANNVTVKILYANASAGLPPLPSDFWTAFPGDSANTTNWKPIDVSKVIPSLSPTLPTILEWDWLTPTSAADHTCLLMVVDSPDDPIPAANKVFNVDTLGVIEKHVGFKNLHVVNALPGTIYWTPFQFFGDPEVRHTVRISPLTVKKWSVGFMFQKNEHMNVDVNGVTIKEPTQAMLIALKKKLGSEIEKYDTSKVYMVDDTANGGTLAGMELPKTGLQSMLLLVPPMDAVLDETMSISLLHEDHNKDIVGGSTFVLRIIK